MPKSKYANLPVKRLSTASAPASPDGLSEQEKQLQEKLFMNDKEKAAAAEERRRLVKEYLRNGRDANGYMMGQVPKVF